MKALLKKGFKRTDRQDEDECIYPGTLLRTHISRGGRETLSFSRRKLMATQIGYRSRQQFDLLVNCQTTAEAFRNYLIAEGRLPNPD